MRLAKGDWTRGLSGTASRLALLCGATSLLLCFFDIRFCRLRGGAEVAAAAAAAAEAEDGSDCLGSAAFEWRGLGGFGRAVDALVREAGRVAAPEGTKGWRALIVGDDDGEGGR